MKFHDIYSVGASRALDLFNKVGWAMPAEAQTGGGHGLPEERGLIEEVSEWRTHSAKVKNSHATDIPNENRLYSKIIGSETTGLSDPQTCNCFASG